MQQNISIKSILNGCHFNNIGIAFVDRYKEIFIKYFNFDCVYENIISKESMNSYDTIFHITLEINDLSHQKYDRKNIEQLILNYFSVKRFRKTYSKTTQEIKKISIFPISKSPLRTMYPDLINNFCKYHNQYFEIFFFLFFFQKYYID